MSVGNDYIPSVTLVDRLEDYFIGKKELGREVAVLAPTKQDITIVCSTQAHTTYKNTDIYTLVKDAITAFFAKGERPMGETLQPSDLMTIILGITGVRSCSISFDGQYTPITLDAGTFAGLTTLIEDGINDSIVITGGLS